MNTLLPEVRYSAGGVIESFVVKQTHKPEYPTLRQHTVEVGLFDLEHKSGHAVLRESVRVTIDAAAATDLKALVGKKKPDFVFLNYNDHGFAKL